MKFLCGALFSWLSVSLTLPLHAQTFTTSDIDNFWMAYDQIVSTQDSVERYGYLREYYLDRASPGLKKFMWASGLSTQLYLEMINDYPLFWKSIRPNTLRARKYIPDVVEALGKFKKLYPEMKSGDIYYLIGCMNSGIMSMDGNMMLGAEVMMGDETSVTSELPDRWQYLKESFAVNSREKFVRNNVKGYIHAQLKESGRELLPISLQYGIAEFVASLVTDTPTEMPAIREGRKISGKVFRKFEQDMFSIYKYNHWLYGNDNEFGVSGLGTYVGYAICEKYYERATDKQKAVKALITLDYFDGHSLDGIVDSSKLFSAPLTVLTKRFDEHQPCVSGIKQFKNRTHNVDPALTEITLLFSTAMDKQHKVTGLGEKGSDHFPRIYAIDFAEDGTSITYTVKLDPDKEYEFRLEKDFRSVDQIQMKPFLVTFKTARD